MEDRGLHRRTFLKLAAAAGAVATTGIPLVPKAALAMHSWKKKSDFEQYPFTEKLIYRVEDGTLPEKVVKNGCSFCPSACWHMVHVKDGRISNVYGDPDNPMQADPDNPGKGQDGGLCAKGRVGIVQLLYSKYRITRPMKRVGPKPGYKFKPISWDQAYEEIAKKLIDIRDNSPEGAKAVAAKTTDRVSRDNGAPQFRFMHMYGSPNTTHEGYICNDAGGIANGMVLGKGSQTNGFGWDSITQSYDLGDSKMVLWFGVNDATSHPVTHSWMRKRKEIVKSTWVVIDPRMTETALAADLWMGIKPGTDMALVYGMIHFIINNNLYNKEYVEKWVAGFDELKALVNGKGYTPEWAATITGIDVETIKKVARLYATTKPAAVITNAGINHHVNAVDCERVLVFLAAITGNIGVPGGGHVAMHNSGIGVSFPGIKGAPKITEAGLPPQPDYFARAINEGKPYKLKMIFYQGNMTTQNSNTAMVKKALMSPDLTYVSFNLFPQEDTEYADYILPTQIFYEFDHVHRRLDRGLMWRSKVIEPMGETKSELQIWIELAHAMAKHDKKNPPEYWIENMDPRWWKDKRYFWNEVCSKNGGSWSGGITADRMIKLISQQVLRGPCPPMDHPAAKALKPDQLAPDGQHPGTSVMFLDDPSWTLLWANEKFPEGRRFPNDINKVEIYTKELDQKLAAIGHSAIPEFYTSPESIDGLPTLEYLDEFVKSPNLGNSGGGNLVHKVKIGARPDNEELRKKYPLQLTTGRPSAGVFHSISHWSWSLAQISSDRYVQIHPKLAAKLGVKTGDSVKVETPRGGITGPALVWDGIREDTVFVPHTFGPKQRVHEDLGGKTYETVNVLTAHYYDTLSGQNEYKCQLCRVTKTTA
ncbi:MAG: molybdopterin-dependent oxidoreductase [Nitrospirota bacterium]